ncbi:MAG: M48 family metalloprotease [bacterium]|nr:M48 family metalloprotease [bacterium]
MMMRTSRSMGGFGRSAGGASGGMMARILMGLAIVAFSFISYLSSQEFNPVTGENQFVSLTVQQEIALGLQSAPQMIQEYGGLYRDQEVQDAIDAIGLRLVNNSVAANTSWQFEFHVLADAQTINAFALPGGQIFITVALLSQLQTEDEIAGVLAHEIVHVLARHSAQQIAKSNLTNGIVGAVGVASGDASAAQTAAMIGQLVNMRYGRNDELQSDSLGVCLMISAEYDPQGMIRVMEVLERAGGGGGQPEFFSTHPSPENRVQAIQNAIANAASDCPK